MPGWVCSEPLQASPRGAKSLLLKLSKRPSSRNALAMPSKHHIRQIAALWRPLALAISAKRSLSLPTKRTETASGSTFSNGTPSRERVMLSSVFGGDRFASANESGRFSGACPVFKKRLQRHLAASEAAHRQHAPRWHTVIRHLCDAARRNIEQIRKRF